MVRIADLHPMKRKGIENWRCPSFGNDHWVPRRPLAHRKITIITSAALITRDERPFLPIDGRYRPIPDSVAKKDILMSHVSVNFDRTGFQRDLNCVFPRDRLHELADAGIIGAVADTHYAFQGGTEKPKRFEPYASKLAAKLKADGVDTALLVPV